MAVVETLGQALQRKWGIRAHCKRGGHRGIVKIDECRYIAKLDVETVIFILERSFPLSLWAPRTVCPNCPSSNHLEQAAV
jgi:hypothetical protein